MQTTYLKLKKVVNDMKTGKYDDWDESPAGYNEQPNLWYLVAGKKIKFVFRTKPTGKTFSLTTLEGKRREENEYHDISLTTSEMIVTNNKSKLTRKYSLKDN